MSPNVGLEGSTQMEAHANWSVVLTCVLTCFLLLETHGGPHWEPHKL